MNAATGSARAAGEGLATGRHPAKAVRELSEHVIEIVSDSGEGAQRCGQSFGAIAARSTGKGLHHQGVQRPQWKPSQPGGRKLPGRCVTVQATSAPGTWPPA